MVDTIEQARLVERIVGQLRTSQTNNIGRVLSVASLVPDETKRKLSLLAQIQHQVCEARSRAPKQQDRVELDRLLSLTRAQPWTVDEVPRSIRRRFQALDGRKTFVLLWPRRQLNTDEEVGRWVTRIERIQQTARDRGVDVVILDESRVLARVTRVIRADLPPMVLTAAVTVLLILFVLFRGVGRVILVYGALLSGVLSMLGVMALFEIDFTMFNVIALPMVVGIGIDNAVHILHAYEKHGAGSVVRVVETVGRAALLASATTAIGFGATTIAHQHGIRMMGVLAVIGVFATFTATTVALPSLLCVLERLRGRRPQRRSPGA